MSPENKVTEVSKDATVEDMDTHMEKMNNEGFELLYVQDKPYPCAMYRLYWKKVQWTQ